MRRPPASATDGGAARAAEPALLPALALVLLALWSTACGGCASPGPQPAAGDGPGAAGGMADRTEPAPETSAPTDDPAGSEDDGGLDDASPPALRVDGDYLPAEVATIGWDGLAQAPIVLVRDLRSGRVVPIWVGLAEAQSIAAALHEVDFPRPMTHDLMANLLVRLDATMEELLIHALIDNTYFALIRLRVPGREQPLLVDTRPSDGMALALRTGAAIRMSREIVEQSPDFEFMAPEGEDQVVRALGLTLVAPTERLRELFDLPERPGLVVTRAIGEAEAKGLRRGDYIVSIAGEVPEQPVDFLDALGEAPTDQPFVVTYWRDGAEHTAELDPTAEDAEEDGPPQVA